MEKQIEMGWLGVYGDENYGGRSLIRLFDQFYIEWDRYGWILQDNQVEISWSQHLYCDHAFVVAWSLSLNYPCLVFWSKVRNNVREVSFAPWEYVPDWLWKMLDLFLDRVVKSRH